MPWVVATLLWAVLAGAAQAQSLEERAEHGDPTAQFELGTQIDLGDGVPADAHAAFLWFQRAAEAGLPEAEFNVAVMLDSGRGVVQNSSEAAGWYGRSAARGNHRAQYNLALLYAAGDGVPLNGDLAAFWFRQASAGLPIATRRLATLPPTDRTGPLAAATLSAPHGQVATGPAPVEFVWSAPAQPELIHYLIEIRVLDSAGSLEVYSEFTDGSAVLAPLREIPGDYAWRVFSLARIAARYQASDWTYFTVVPPPAIAPPLTER